MSGTNGVTALPEISVVKLQQRVVGRVEILGDDGSPRKVDVLQLDGGGFLDAVAAESQTEAQQIVAAYENVARCLPDATATEVRKIPPDAAQSILHLASRNIEAVKHLAMERAEGNASGRASRSSKQKRSASPVT